MDNAWEVRVLQNRIDTAEAETEKLKSCVKALAVAIERLTIATPQDRAFACEIAESISRAYADEKTKKVS